MPAVETNARVVSTKPTHVVYTRTSRGQATIYVDGKVRGTKTIGGTLKNWNAGYRLALGNEASGDRPWLGTFFRVAIFSRALKPEEVVNQFRSGHEAPALVAQKPEDTSKQLFREKVAAIISKHCLECHDATTKKGGLDLSHQTAVAQGGESGKPIVPNKPDESLFWQLIEAGDMPKQRDSLSAADKKVIAEWIKTGARWTNDFIDPANYAQGSVGSRQVWIQRLTVPEYIETVRATVGVDIAKDARRILPVDVRADGFSNTAYNLKVDLKHIQAYSQLAALIVERMDVVKFARRFSNSQRLTDPNMRPLISKMGQWILRGPIEDDELNAFRGISTTVASAGGDFREAIGFIIEAMLQSPRFIYRVENQQGGGVRPVGDFELASRMSYIIWGSSPDAELMSLAQNGRISDSKQVGTQVNRMLQDPRAIQRSLNFAHEWLDLGRLSTLQPSRTKFPNWDKELANDMREETLAFFQEVVWNRKQSISNVLNAQLTVASPRLAQHYGLKLPSGQTKPEKFDLKSVPSRGGLLTQGAVLTIGGDEASMVTRGLFVLRDLLRGVVKDPPPCVNTTPVPTKAGLSQRSIAEARIKNETCGGCHSKFEPLAFGLERFDGIGAFHQQDEHGNSLREDGEILFPGTANAVKYQSVSELMDRLAKSDRVKRSLTWKVTQFALGRPLTFRDAEIVDDIHKEAEENGGTYQSIVAAIVQSDLVQLSRTED